MQSLFSRFNNAKEGMKEKRRAVGQASCLPYQCDGQDAHPTRIQNLLASGK